MRGLSDNSGAITDTYTYDAWGVLLASTGTTQNSYRYTAVKHWNEDLEMVFLRANAT